MQNLYAADSAHPNEQGSRLAAEIIAAVIQEQEEKEAIERGDTMKTAICYYSRHHGNTLKVLQAMAQEGDVDLINVADGETVQLEDYDCVGFASGVYFGRFHAGVIACAQKGLPQGKPVFFVGTYGAAKGSGFKTLAAIAKEKNCPVLGAFGCRGHDTFGPWKMVGGIAKGHPNARDLDKARAFYRGIQTSRY